MRKTLIKGLAAVLCLAIIGAFSGCAQKANPGNSENDLTDSVNSPIDAVTDSIVGTWVAYAHINETGEKEILDDTSNETGDILERFVFNEDGHAYVIYVCMGNAPATEDIAAWAKLILTSKPYAWAISAPGLVC